MAARESSLVMSQSPIQPSVLTAQQLFSDSSSWSCGSVTHPHQSSQQTWGRGWNECSVMLRRMQDHTVMTAELSAKNSSLLFSKACEEEEEEEEGDVSWFFSMIFGPTEEILQKMTVPLIELVEVCFKCIVLYLISLLFLSFCTYCRIGLMIYVLC